MKKLILGLLFSSSIAFATGPFIGTVQINPPGGTQTGGFNVSSGTVTGILSAGGNSLPTTKGIGGQFLQTNGVGGTSWQNPTSSGSSAPPIGVSNNSVIISSPTAQINFLYPITVSLGGSATAQVMINCSSITCEGQINPILNTNVLQSGSTAYPQFLYVGSSATIAGSLSANNISGNGSGLTSLNASNINTGTIGISYLPSGLILNQNTLQSGATFYVSSGTVAGQFNLPSLNGVLYDSVGIVQGGATTTNLPEGANEYFTTLRATSSITATSPISNTSGNISMTQAGASTSGWLSSVDWINFDSKAQASGTILNQSILQAGATFYVTSGTVAGNFYAGGNSYPINSGTNGQFLETNGAGITSWQTASGGGGGSSSTLAINNNGVQISSPTAIINFASPLLAVATNVSTTTISIPTNTYIQNQNTLQSGATFFVQQGYINGYSTPFSIVASTFDSISSTVTFSMADTTHQFIGDLANGTLKFQMPNVFGSLYNIVGSTLTSGYQSTDPLLNFDPLHTNITLESGNSSLLIGNNTMTYVGAGQTAVQYGPSGGTTYGTLNTQSAGQGESQEWKNSLGVGLDWVSDNGELLLGTYTSTMTAMMQIQSSTGNIPGIIVEASTNNLQTADLQDWQNSLGVNVDSVTASGTIYAGEGINSTSATITGLTANLPIQTDSNKNLISSAINLSGSQITGSLPAASIAAGALGSSVIASSLTATGVTAGSYTNSNITVNAEGQITNASNGSGGGGGAASPLGVFNGTSNNPGVVVSSPTAALNFNSGQMTVLSQGSTAYIALNTSSVTLQGAIVSSITVNSVYPGALQSGSYTNITGVGTLTAGVWNGTALTSTYLPTDVDYTDIYKVFTASKTVTAAGGFGVTYGVSAGSITVTGLSASLPVQTNGSEQLISSAINLSGSQVTGILPSSNLTGVIFSTNTLQSGSTAYPQFLSVGSTATVSGAASIGGVLNMNSNLINNVTNPVSAQDAATKNYVDTTANGIDWKAAGFFATTTALPSNVYNNGSSGVGATLTGVGFGALSIDGYTQTAGNRVLIKNEATAANNGIYTVTTVGAVATLYVLTRTADFNQASEIDPGDAIFISSGTANASTSWILTGASTTTVVGTTPLNWTQFAATYSAANPVTLTGTQFGLNCSSATCNGTLVAGTGITLTPSGGNTTISASGGGGGSPFSLVVTSGTQNGYTIPVSSSSTNTTIIFSTDTFHVNLINGTTDYVSVDPYFNVNISSSTARHYSGITTVVTCGATFSEGQIGYITNGGTMALADNTAASTTPGVYLALGSCTNTNPGLFLVRGMFGGTSGQGFNLTPGQTVYLGTSGGITATAPTTTNYVIQVLGIMAPRVFPGSGANSQVFDFEPSLDTVIYQ